MFKFIRRIFVIILLIIGIILGYFTYEGYQMYQEAIEKTSIEEKVSEIKSKVENYTKYIELPQDYINAVLAVEDRRFFDHNGINIISIFRAMITNLKEKRAAEGGSTITQQLAKNIYFNQKKELTRKIAETFMAVEIEKNLSKEEIFELYVNTIYFGDGYYNIYDACKGYFDKEVEEMDLNECTLLAGIPNAPSVYSPTKNPKLAKERQEQVIRKMVKFYYLTQEEADKLLEIVETK